MDRRGTAMSAWQGYKVMLLGLAGPAAAVIVEIGHSGSTQLPPVTEQPTTLQPPATTPLAIIPPAPADTEVPARLPVHDEAAVRAIVAGTVRNPSATQRQDPDDAPSDAGGSP